MKRVIYSIVAAALLACIVTIAPRIVFTASPES